LATTPADPSCPGAHSTVSAAAASILAALYGDHVTFTVTSPTLPGAVRSFDTFHAAATEAGLSRIYAGIHTRLDHQAGLLLGARIGQYTLRHTLDNGPRTCQRSGRSVCRCSARRRGRFVPDGGWAPDWWASW
jgi:membrane-associated phospholipid phosphatase